MIYINSKEIKYEGLSLYEILLRENYDPLFVACEVNKLLVKRNEFKSFIPKDNSRIEVFSFVGGG